jgi:hypothetical protein
MCIYLHIQSVHFAGLLVVQIILSADTGISQQTEDHSFGDRSQCYAIECDRSFYCALLCLYDSCESMSNQSTL